MPEATWWVTYHDNYPGKDGVCHGYFANADCGHTQIRNAVIEIHLAAGCLIDHQARISEVEIPEWVKKDLEQIHWLNETSNS